MKKVLFTLAVVLGLATAANAQLIIGGGVSFNGGTEKTTWNGNWGARYGFTPGTKVSTFGFGIAPTVAYGIGENMEVGANLQFTYDQTTNFIPVENLDGKSAAHFEKDMRSVDFSWSINPYFRYRLFDVKGFGFWLQAKAELGTSLETKVTAYAYGNDNTNQRTQAAADLMNQSVPGHKYSRFNGAGYIQPVLTYGINEHWILYSELDLLSVGVWGYAEKTTDDGLDRDGNATSITETKNSCNFNLGLFQGRAITLGVVYKF